MSPRLKFFFPFILFLVIFLISSSSLTQLEVEEGELVTLNIFARDEDNDNLTVAYAAPVNVSGQWQTTYDDAGEHTTLVTVSDGTTDTTEEVQITVTNVNRPPVMINSTLVVAENATADLQQMFRDPDQDVLSFYAEDYFDEEGKWQTGYADAGEYALNVTVSDGTVSIEEELSVVVTDVETAPVFLTTGPFVLQENQLFRHAIEVIDSEGDNVTLEVLAAPEGADFAHGTFSWTPAFDAVKRKSGLLSNLLNRFRLDKRLGGQKTYELRLQACGRELCREETFSLLVKDTNQPPVLENLPVLTAAETELVVIDPTAQDSDGDYIRYYFSTPLARDGTWQTDYNSNGEYTVWVTASDGFLSDTKAINVSVANMNRPPVLTIQQDQYKINEGQALSIAVTGSDGDGDEVVISLERLPPGASFAEGVFSWVPATDSVVQDVPGWWNTFVSRYPLLNRRFNREMTGYYLEFTASDGEFSTHQPLLVLVKNLNQPPQFVASEPASDPIEVKADVPIAFSAGVQDLDNDALTYDWSFGPWEQSVAGAGTVQRTFVTPGYKEVQLRVSDGLHEIKKKWVVHVLPEEKPIILPEQPVTVPVTYVTYFIEG